MTAGGKQMTEFLLFSEVDGYSGDTPETLRHRSCDICGDSVVNRPEISFVFVQPDQLSLCETCFFRLDLNQ